MRPLHAFSFLTLWLSLILATFACSMLVIVSLMFPPVGVVLLVLGAYLWFTRRR